MTHRAAKWVYLIILTTFVIPWFFDIAYWIATSFELMNNGYSLIELIRQLLDRFIDQTLLDVWHLALIAVLTLFVLVDGKRLGIKNGWVFPLVGFFIGMPIGFFGYLSFKELMLERDPTPDSQPNTILGRRASMIYLYALGIAVAFFIIHQIAYTLTYRYLALYTFDPGGSWFIGAGMLFFELPFILYFLIEQSRREIQYWWMAIPVQILLSFLIAIPLFMFFKESAIETAPTEIEDRDEPLEPEEQPVP